MGKLIVGLGNIGEEYKNTRHNVGFKVLDALAKKLNIEFDKKMFNGEFGVFLLNNEKIVIAKPHTYMNLSGNFVKAFMDYFHVDINDLIVIYDDISINLGEFKLRTTGSSGGQNGIKNIIEKLNTQDFKRIKIGVGPKPANIDLVNFVLGKFNKLELEKFSKVINQVCNMLLHVNEKDFSNLITFAK